MRIAHVCISAALLAAGLVFFHPRRSNAGIWLLMPMLSAICFEDLIARRISNKILIIMLAAGVLAALVNGRPLLFQFAAPVIYGVIFILMSLISRGGLGMGDAKLIAVMSVYYGVIDMFNVIFAAAVIELAISIVVLIRTKNLRAEIPFAPAIGLGAVIALAWLI